MYPRLLTAIFSVLFLTANFYAGDEIPGWMHQAGQLPVPAYDKDVPAVVLHDEEQVTLDSDGKLVTVENYAVKLINREGRGFAKAVAYYLVSSGKIRDIQGWLLRPNGSVKYYDKKMIVDAISDSDDVYNEGRVKIIDASDDIEVGGIFGYTVISEDTPLFYQDIWSFQSRLPTLVSRYSLNLPTGWKASSITFNTAELKPQVSGTSYTWEMRNLMPIPPEPLSPSVGNIAPRISVNYAPENNAKTVNRAFANWTDVSRWATEMHTPQVIITDEIAIKAKELTANAKTELEKIRAIGNFVQNLQYISIDIGVGYGNGYRPRSSVQVLNRGYGDCKDKANLMRAMLKTLKIEAYPIAIYSGDPTFVREEWASPRQFNHCIIAVKVSDETNAPTILNHEKLGRLLIFDATDSYTPVGDLPDYLQGSNALIIAGDDGGLAKMPTTPPDTDLLERTIEANLTEMGELKGKISERTKGQASTAFRREIRELSASDYKKAVEGWLTRGATGAQLVSMTPKDRESEAGFDLDVEFSAPRYGQLMQNRLLIFKPVIVGRRNAVFLTEAKRNNPIEMDSNAMRETIIFNLPANFTVDEVPDPVNLETPFGKYSTKYEVKDGKLHFSRFLTTKRMTIPVDKYVSVKDFYAKILAAEQAPVVLLRK
ncbi:MAG: transglutaminase-like domain-containing protein [Pyrinomonadaceae bacterium]|nr:transglutaminase-like domain-containing protein [Pyrinomonadaceae bacterium]